VNADAQPVAMALIEAKKDTLPGHARELRSFLDRRPVRTPSEGRG
jgi:hypothetical protein